MQKRTKQDTASSEQRGHSRELGTLSLKGQGRKCSCQSDEIWERQSVPDSNLTGSYLWPTQRDVCFTVQQQRAGSPEFTGIYGLPSSRRHPAPPPQSSITCQLKSRTNFLIIHEMRKCRSTKLQIRVPHKVSTQANILIPKSAVFQNCLHIFVLFCPVRQINAHSILKFNLALNRFILLGEVEAALVTAEKMRWNYPKSNRLLSSALGIKWTFLQWGHVVNPTMVFFDVGRPWSFSGRNLTHHHSQLMETSVPVWSWCGWKL